MCSHTLALIVSILKCVFKIFNIVLVLCGLTIMIIGAIVKANSSIYTNFIGTALLVLPVVILVIGGIVAGIAFLGCCGAKRNNLLCLYVYSVCLIIFIVASAGLATALNFYYRSIKGKALEKEMLQFMKRYNNTKYERDTWDGIQTSFLCCGVNSSDDWNNSIPLSCCHTGRIDEEQMSSYCEDLSKGSAVYMSKDGCLKKLKSSIVQNSHMLIYVMIVATVIEVLGLTVSCLIINDIRS